MPATHRTEKNMSPRFRSRVSSNHSESSHDNTPVNRSFGPVSSKSGGPISQGGRAAGSVTPGGRLAAGRGGITYHGGLKSKSDVTRNSSLCEEQRAVGCDKSARLSVGSDNFEEASFSRMNTDVSIEMTSFASQCSISQIVPALPSHENPCYETPSPSPSPSPSSIRPIAKVHPLVKPGTATTPLSTTRGATRTNLIRVNPRASASLAPDPKAFVTYELPVTLEKFGKCLVVATLVALVAVAFLIVTLWGTTPALVLVAVAGVTVVAVSFVCVLIFCVVPWRRSKQLAGAGF